MRIAVSAFLSLISAGCNDVTKQSDDAADFVSPEAKERHEYLVNHSRPPASLVAAIEQKVSRNPCVGNLDRWERLYSYGLDEQQDVDENKIVIDFRQAGVHGFKAGRRIGYPNEGIGNDDRSFNLVWGSFDRAKDTLDIKYCGPNMPGG
jgi:hypothetical protein